jgi:hypothetical protein
MLSINIFFMDIFDFQDLFNIKILVSAYLLNNFIFSRPQKERKL